VKLKPCVEHTGGIDGWAYTPGGYMIYGGGGVPYGGIIG